jgi:hypothetical protein
MRKETPSEVGSVLLRHKGRGVEVGRLAGCEEQPLTARGQGPRDLRGGSGRNHALHIVTMQSASVLSVMAQAWLAYKFKFKSSQ